MISKLVPEAEPEDIKELKRLHEALLDWEGLPEEAVKIHEALGELHEKAGTLRSLDGSTALHAYAWSQMLLWHFAKAEEAYEELISLRGEVLGKTHPSYYEAKNDLAMVLQQTQMVRFQSLRLVSIR